MKSRFVAPLSAFALMFGLGGLAGAQTPSQQEQQDKSEVEVDVRGQQGTDVDVNVQNQRRDAQQAQQQMQLFVHDDIIGLKIHDKQNREVGEIQGLVVGVPDGYIRYAAVSGQAITGSDDQLAAVPWEALQIMTERQEGQAAPRQDRTAQRDQQAQQRDQQQKPEFAQLQVDPQIFRDVEKFAEDSPQWPNQPDQQLMAQIRQQLGEERIRVGFRGALDQQQDQTFSVRLDRLADAKVISQDDRSIGDVEEFVIDAKEGKIACVKIGTGGLLDLGEKVYALPMEATELRESAEDEGELLLRLTISTDTLQQAPVMTDDENLQQLAQKVKQFKEQHVGTQAQGQQPRQNEPQQQPQPQPRPEQPQPQPR